MIQIKVLCKDIVVMKKIHTTSGKILIVNVVMIMMEVT
jgi:hypothetical protein